MTATNSNKTSFFWKRYLNNLKDSKKSLVVNIILNILGLPAMSIATMIMFYAENNEIETIVEDGCYTFFVIGFCTLGASVLMGATIALSQYKYLYKKTITDMNYSLPLNGTQRFFADYLSGLTIYVVPLVISIIVSLIMLGTGQIFIDMNEMWETMPFMLEIALIVIMAMIQYYAITVFALTFCGNGFESHFSVISFVVMIPATIGCLWLAIVETSGFGIASEAIFTKGIFTSTNPAGAFAFFIKFVEAYDAYDGYKESLAKTAYMLAEWVFTVLVSVAFYVCSAWQLHKFRKAEDVSKPYVYRSFFYAIMTMAVFCILSLFIIFDGFIFAGVVICAVIWFVMEIITRRGFKKFWTAGVSFVTAVVSVFAICGICKVTDGFGASRHIPSALSVDYVTVDINCDNLYLDEIRFKDKDVIKEAIALNKDVVDRHFNPQNYSYNEIKKLESSSYYGDVDIDIDLTYSGMTGSKTMRRYKAYSGLADNLVKAILLSDEYAEYSASQLGSKSYRDMQLSTTYNLNLCDSLYNSVSYSPVTERKMNEIRKAYETDMKNMTEEELINGKVYCYINSYWVLESFENTIKALDADIPPIDMDSFNRVYIDFVLNPQFTSNFKNYVEKEDNKLLYNYNYYSYDNCILVDKITSISPTTNYSYGDDDVVYASVGNKDVIELIKNSTPIIIGEMPLAKVIIENRVFYIRNTPENAELIEKIDFGKSKNNKVSYDDYGWDTEEVYY